MALWRRAGDLRPAHLHSSDRRLVQPGPAAAALPPGLRRSRLPNRGHRAATAARARTLVTRRLCGGTADRGPRCTARLSAIHRSLWWVHASDCLRWLHRVPESRQARTHLYGPLNIFLRNLDGEREVCRTPTSRPCWTATPTPSRTWAWARDRAASSGSSLLDLDSLRELRALRRGLPRPHERRAAEPAQADPGPEAQHLHETGPALLAASAESNAESAALRSCLR